ncbi:histone deacetylase family protein [Pseudidiomarina terrestris]|uniref:Histone deacetylase family protein n=1 Tax=Pseudidiomarina terrestris TaxID=2820060 RepID=A0AAW7R1V6_9GAMM|nr:MULTISPECIES: histone deacetylase family protein [unclassified Pseudidiomarina]MDN7124937.1 histone deacetylase family protein [Pseudidiomarina sp. 1APP75-32.1]MDN7126010.1 histone deacetylase family protein [Pseudidiomarina sp. 1APR75-33.1]MDN7135905.1 histone deacetylase family protein [Pseudidiomarina sp. 1ASP75-5]MDN7138157.1 histone deacetylase family protein [Pseudidiomarina sp. 1ASP75-14]MEA3588070.1 histone deacetylase family protein [Pseudidiomarina sp. 1APP75-27a]
MSITLFSHPACMQHQVSEIHPEEPARMSAINDQIIRSGLELAIRQRDGKAASKEQLYHAHDVNYVHEIFNKAPDEGHVWLDPDTLMTPGSLQAALYAAGCGIDAVDEVMHSDNPRAFCVVRPPGHHATHDQAMGFCIFNNIAVAATHAMAAYDLERVAIIDFDVHHGNGTEDIFSNDERVLLCSSFQHPFYPDTGADTISPHIINSPMPAGTSGEQWRAEVEQRWLPALDHFSPQLILVSAGFDGHAEDDMGNFNLREDDYFWIAKRLKELAERHCEGRVIGMLEGGYDHSSLGRSVVAFVKGLI